jgi:hypothetical protein
VGANDGMALGTSVGANDGLALGTSVGANDGLALGTSVGANDGLALGTSVGANDGLALGTSVGANDGLALGTSVGFVVGVAVGWTVGVFVGIVVAVKVGVAVGVRVNVGRKVGDLVGVNVGIFEGIPSVHCQATKHTTKASTIRTSISWIKNELNDAHRLIKLSRKRWILYSVGFLFICGWCTSLNTAISSCSSGPVSDSLCIICVFVNTKKTKIIWWRALNLIKWFNVSSINEGTVFINIGRLGTSVITWICMISFISCTRKNNKSLLESKLIRRLKGTSIDSSPSFALWSASSAVSSKNFCDSGWIHSIAKGRRTFSCVVVGIRTFFVHLRGLLVSSDLPLVSSICLVILLTGLANSGNNKMTGQGAFRWGSDSDVNVGGFLEAALKVDYGIRAMPVLRNTCTEDVLFSLGPRVSSKHTVSCMMVGALSLWQVWTRCNADFSKVGAIETLSLPLPKVWHELQLKRGGSTPPKIAETKIHSKDMTWDCIPS